MSDSNEHDEERSPVVELEEDVGYWLQFTELENPELTKPGFKPVGKENSQHKEAFLYWTNLPDHLRSYQQVSKKFGVSRVSVRAWALSFNWDTRRSFLRKQETELIQEQSTHTIVDDLNLIAAGCRIAITVYMQDVQQGSQTVSAKDVALLGQTLISIKKSLEGPDDGKDKKKHPLDAILGAMDESTKKIFGDVASGLTSGEIPLPHDSMIQGAQEQREDREANYIDEEGENVNAFAAEGDETRGT